MGIQRFRTSDNEIVTGERLAAALSKVADGVEVSAKRTRESNYYASHVTEQQKDQHLERQMYLAAEIRRGENITFWLWQRVNQELTGKCVGIFGEGG